MEFHKYPLILHVYIKILRIKIVKASKNKLCHYFNIKQNIN